MHPCTHFCMLFSALFPIYKQCFNWCISTLHSLCVQNAFSTHKEYKIETGILSWTCKLLGLTGDMDHTQSIRDGEEGGSGTYEQLTPSAPTHKDQRDHQPQPEHLILKWLGPRQCEATPDYRSNVLKGSLPQGPFARPMNTEDLSASQVRPILARWLSHTLPVARSEAAGALARRIEHSQSWSGWSCSRSESDLRWCNSRQTSSSWA